MQINIKNILLFMFYLIRFSILILLMFVPMILIMIMSIIWSFILGESMKRMSMHIFNRWLTRIGEYFETITWYNRNKKKKTI